MAKIKHHLIFDIIVFLVFIGTGAPLLAEEPEDPGRDENGGMLEEKGPSFKLNGSYKNLFIVQRIKNYHGLDLFDTERKTLVTDLNRIRLSPEFLYADKLVVHVDYDNEAIFSNYNKSMEFNSYWRPSTFNELIHMDWEPAHNRDIYYRTKIHRAYAKLTLGDVTLTLGRQQIRYGSGRLWNPLDILSPISPTFIEGGEEQRGTDAVRFDYYFNETTELSLVYDQKRYDDKIDKTHPRNANSLVRFKTAIGGVDAAVMGGYVSRRSIGGADVSVTVLDGILRGGAIYAHPEEGKWYVQGSAGYEYTFRNGLYFLLEYFYNSNGLNYNRELKNIYYESLVFGVNQGNYFRVSNQFITFNKHYAGLALGYDIHPLVRGEFFSIYDFQGSGIFFNISLKYNVLQNMDLTVGAMIAHVFGDREHSDFSALHEQYMYYASLSFFF